jgi:PPOX class probable F420-dependent enzyme
MSPGERDKFLSGRRVAVLVTLAQDGSSVPTPIWYLYRDGLFYFRTAADAAKTKNIERDKRASVCVQDERPPYRAVVAHGTAEVRSADDGIAAEMPRRYLGMIGAIGYRAAAANIEAGPEVTIVLTPERFVSFDFSGDTPWFGRLWLAVKRVLPPWL